MKHYIYKAVNTVNGKIYIGRTKDLNARIIDHYSEARNGSQMKFHDAIREYGEESWDWEVIDVANSYDEVKDLEHHYILVTESYKENRGYNTNGMYISGGNNPSKAIDMYDLEGNFIKSFLNAQQVEDESNGKYLARNVRRNCSKETQRYKDRLFVFSGESPEPYRFIPSRSIGIEVYDLKSGLVGSFQSLKECGKKLQLNPDNISLQLREKQVFYPQYSFKRK